MSHDTDPSPQTQGDIKWDKPPAGVAERRDPPEPSEEAPGLAAIRRRLAQDYLPYRPPMHRTIVADMTILLDMVDELHRELSRLRAIDRRGTGAEPTAEPLRALVEQFVATYSKQSTPPWMTWAERFAGALRAGGPPKEDAYKLYQRALWHVISGWSGHDEEPDGKGCPCVERDADSDECNCGYSDAMKATHEAYRALSGGPPPAPHQETET